MIRTLNDDQDKLQKLYDFISNENYQKTDDPYEGIQVPALYVSLEIDIADSLSANLVWYINSDPDGKMYKNLNEALSRRKPFRHFNHLIHPSGERQA